MIGPVHRGIGKLMYLQAVQKNLKRLFTSPLIAITILLAAVLVAYEHSGSNGFAYDDQKYIIENPQVNHGISGQNIRWAFTSFYCSNWHPITWMSHMVDVSLFGLNPAMPHLVNILLHFLNVVLLYVLLRSLTGAHWRSLLAALIFGVHPLNVETVAWISERKNLLSQFCMLTALIAYSKYVLGKRPQWYLLSIASYAVGLASKPSIVVLPVLLVLFDFWPLRRIAGPRDSDHAAVRPDAVALPTQVFLIDKVPFLLLMAASCVVTVLSQRAGGAIASLSAVGIPDRVIGACLSYAAYIGKMLWPVNLSCFYPKWAGIHVWQPGIALFSLLVITVASLAVAKRFPWALVGWLWFLIALIPVIGIVQVGSQSIADRYMYLPMIGPAIVASWSTGALLQTFKQRGVWAAAVFLWVAALGALCLHTRNQVKYWRDDATLFSHACRVTGENLIACLDAGCGLMSVGKEADALRFFFQAIRIDPACAGAYNNSASALFTAGNPKEALVYINRGIELAPDDMQAHYLRASILNQLAQYDRAIVDLQLVVRHDPQNARAYYNMGVALAKSAHLQDAIDALSQALALDPGYTRARIARERVLAIQGTRPSK
jgi:hypothetical protein